ncbi:MAG: GW dipeptide domain-containing protein [Pyrinomonadaceae bacterium]
MRTDFTQNKILLLAAILLIALTLGGCGAVKSAVENATNLTGLNETGTVIAKRAQIRSSYAVVAADLLEVKRGQNLDILEETDFEKVHWYRVRAHDDDSTEGWIEAQNIITGDALEKSKKLAEEDKDLQPQATAQLRAMSNLRLAPEQNPDNILYKLENGATFEILNWKYVPKVQANTDADDPSKSDAHANSNVKTPKTKDADVEAAKEANTPQDLDEKYDIWYKVRLDPSVSPAPAGWVFGRQVQLQVPSDIVFYQSDAKKFVTWQRLDQANNNEKSSTKDAARIVTPGSWVILSRSNTVKSKDGNEPDFEGIIVLGYDKYNEEHYTGYRIENVWGDIPLKVEGTGDTKTFTVRLRNAAGQPEEKRFTVVKDAKGHLRVTPPANIFTDKNGK